MQLSKTIIEESLARANEALSRRGDELRKMAPDSEAYDRAFHAMFDEIDAAHAVALNDGVAELKRIAAQRNGGRPPLMIVSKEADSLEPAEASRLGHIAKYVMPTIGTVPVASVSDAIMNHRTDI